MKSTKTLTLLATVTLMAAAFPAHADHQRMHGARNHAPAHAPVAARHAPPPAVAAAPIASQRPAFRHVPTQPQHRPVVSHHPAAMHRAVFMPPVFVPPVFVHRPMVIERPYYEPAIDAEAPAPVYAPEPAYYPAHHEPRGPNVAGAIGGAAIGGVIGNVIGALIGALIGSGF